jgi:hypothetical protein
LFPTKPNSECAPTSNNRDRYKTYRAYAQAQRLHAAIRPGPELIATPIPKCIDEAFRFVFVFAPQNGEQDLASRPHEGESARATRNLKHGQHNEHWRETHRGETKQAKNWHEQERHGNTQELH